MTISMANMPGASLGDRKLEISQVAIMHKNLPHGREPVFVDWGEFVCAHCCKPKRSSGETAMISVGK